MNRSNKSIKKTKGAPKVKRGLSIKQSPKRKAHRKMGGRLSLLLEAVVSACFSRKGEDVKVLELGALTSVTDFFVICSGESSVQLRAIRDAVRENAKKIDEKPWHIENGENWILMDFVDIVVHIFDRETRLFYNLERLWGDAKITICDSKDYD